MSPMIGRPRRTMEPGTQLAHDVLRTIRQIVRRISEHSRSLTREAGLTVPQLVCLKAVGDLEENETEITVKMVAERVHLAPATVSRIVDRLTNTALVLRERRSKDRRKVCLSLTAAGIERHQTLPTPLQDSFVRRLMDLEEGERIALLESLRRVSELMEAEGLDAAPMLTPGADVKPGSYDE